VIVVQAPVPAQRQPAGDAVAGGHLDRRGAVIGREPVPAAEPGHVADIADHGRGDDRADPEDLSQGGAGGADRHRQLLLRLEQQGIDAAQVGHELGRQFGAGLLHGAARPGPGQDLLSLICVNFLGEAAGGTSSHNAACSRQATWFRVRLKSRCRLAQIFSTAAWSSGLTGRHDGERSATMATERASLGSFLFTAPAASSRTRAASLGYTSSTSSPAATSSWASRCPSPPAPSTAQIRSGQAAAQASSRCACAAEARTRTWPSMASSAPGATVCDPLCGSTPIMTATTCPFLAFHARWDRGGHALLRIGHRHTSYEPRHGKVRQAGTSFESQAANRSAADVRASPAGPLNATASAVTPAPILQ
jgi:hypothetical protein